MEIKSLCNIVDQPPVASGDLQLHLQVNPVASRLCEDANELSSEPNTRSEIQQLTLQHVVVSVVIVNYDRQEAKKLKNVVVVRQADSLERKMPLLFRERIAWQAFNHDTELQKVTTASEGTAYLLCGSINQPLG